MYKIIAQYGKKKTEEVESNKEETRCTHSFPPSKRVNIRT